MMRAAVCPDYGGPEVVRVEQVPVPECGPGQVRVHVGAAAVNFPDVLLVANQYQLQVPPPFVVGSELAGVVLEVGDGIEDVAPGDRVAATGLVGAFAEEAVVGGRAVWKVPDGVALDVAAAFGVAHRTAYHVLRSIARIEPGEELIVLGAGGGVGLAAVQLGALLGATVTAVASSEQKLAVAAANGATNLVDHRQGDLRGALRAVLPNGGDVVVDPVGGDLAEPALRSLRYGGRFVTVGYASGTIPRIPLNLVLLKGVAILGFQFVDFIGNAPDLHARDEAELMALLGEGRTAPHIGATFPLDDVVDALRLVGEGGAVGKVVLEIGPAVIPDAGADQTSAASPPPSAPAQ
jgi:NADPH2:quinone reductase